MLGHIQHLEIDNGTLWWTESINHNFPKAIKFCETHGI